MKNQKTTVSGRLARAIEDAILLGHVKEIDAVLESVDGDNSFPEDLRYGLEALRHFRAHYANHSNRVDREHAAASQETSSIDLVARQISCIESSWSSELLDMLNGEDREDRKQAEAS